MDYDQLYTKTDDQGDKKKGFEISGLVAKVNAVS